MARKYRMTPRRKAALKKAQAASAAKRRRTRNRRIAVAGGVAGGIAIGGVAALASRHYVRHLAGGGPKRKTPSAFNPTYQLALPPGRSVTKVRRPKRTIPKRSGVFKVTPGGSANYVKRNRPLYDRRRRAGIEPGYEKKVRSKYDGLSPRTLRRRKQKRG